MYAIAFDLVVVDTETHHPKGVTQAYTEIGAVLDAAKSGVVSKVCTRYSGFPHRTVV